jgi:hypothetical protein
MGIELIDEEAEGLRAMLKRTVEGCFPFNDENRMLRGILAKLDPQPTARPAPPPLPVNRSVMLESRKRARRSR